MQDTSYQRLLAERQEILKAAGIAPADQSGLTKDQILAYLKQLLVLAAAQIKSGGGGNMDPEEAIEPAGADSVSKAISKALVKRATFNHLASEHGERGFGGIRQANRRIGGSRWRLDHGAEQAPQVRPHGAPEGQVEHGCGGAEGEAAPDQHLLPGGRVNAPSQSQTKPFHSSLNGRSRTLLAPGALLPFTAPHAERRTACTK